MEQLTTCRNCGEPLHGEFCSRCGQREGRAGARFLELAGELAGDVVSYDSRFWRTLGLLLFLPGRLTAEFNVGRRARYLPPLRLYLVISFLMFFVMALDARVSVVSGADADNEEVAAALEESGLQGIVGDEEEGGDWSANIGLADEDSPQWLKDVDARMEGNLERLREDPNEYIETMVSYLPQMMFLLLPLFALLIQFFYLFSPFHYLQHLVFALHYHSFVYLLYLLEKALELAVADVGGWLALWLLAYLPLALHRAYGSRWPGAIGKSLLVYFGYGIMLVVGFALVAMVALALL